MVKVLGIVFLLIVMTLLTALVGTVFFYMGWNWGVVPAFGLHEIGLATAFWLSLCLATIGGFFKTSVTAKE